MPHEIGLKTSVSLSSLPPGTPNDSPDHVRLRIRNDRPYHSLNKYHRRSEQSENWRKSWGSGISSDDKEFWTAFQADYEHLMSQTMVPEIINIPNTRQTPAVWNLEECLDRFAQLYSWLKRFNVSIYCKQAAGTDWVIRAREELDRHRCRLDEFNDGAATLIRECPHVKEEVTWRARYVNDAWHGVETALATCNSADQLPRLRRWLSAMESKIKPVSFNHVWTGSQLEARRRENAVLQRDIQEHGSVVASVLRSSSAADGVILERQYHNLLLRCFEWQCHIEALLARQTDKSPVNVSSDSDADGEPLAKCARYNHNSSRLSDDDNHHQLTQQCPAPMDSGNDVVRRRARAYSPSRRCGVAQFSETIAGEFDAITNMADSAKSGLNMGTFMIKHKDTESENETNGTDDAQSSATDGWSFAEEVPKRNCARVLQFPGDQRAETKDLVAGADDLVRMQYSYPIESRDASGESDTDGCVKTQTKNRPLSLGSCTQLLPPLAPRKFSSSESALNPSDSARKRRIRPRKKFSSLRKNQTGLEEWMMNPLSTPPTAVKSECLQINSDSSTESMTLPQDMESGDVTLIQADDTDDDDFQRTPVLFRVGPDAGIVTVAESEKLGGGEEPSSLNTEDLWDNYQEKYASEPYSEEVVDGRNLLECDDYRQLLGSPPGSPRSVQRRRRARQTRPQQQQRTHRLESTDTESEPEEVTRLLNSSLSQHRRVEAIFKGSSFAVPHDELLHNCKTNMQCLQVYLSEIEGSSRVFSDRNRTTVTKMLNQWNKLRDDIERKSCNVKQRESEGNSLRQDLEEFRCELLLLANGREDYAQKRFGNRQQLDVQIAQTKNDLNAVRERKTKLQLLNAAVHRYACIFDRHAARMKSDIAELYELWSNSFDGISRELCNLQDVATKFDEFDVQIAQLQAAFRADHDTLRLVDEALKCGLTGSDIAKCGTLLDDASLLLTEGSLSDSGISDSGSELEMSERERRLAALKNLARHLEAVLEPGSHVLREMMQGIEEAEIELRGLQHNCRKLMARPVGTTDLQISAIIPKASRSPGKRKKSLTFNGSSSSSWFWRVVRAALPFQLALVALLCVACLLEPQCCDSMNNLTGTNFRYIRGPPPV